MRKTLLLLRWFALILAIAYTITPVYWLFLTAMKEQGEIFRVPPVWLARHPGLANFTVAITKSEFFAYAVNSLVVATATAGLTVIIGTLAGYALTRCDFKRADIVLVAILLGQMIPSISVVVPVFVMFKELHLLNSLPGLILAHSAYNLPFTIWILKGFLEDIPRELEEAALVDGCSYFGSIVEILLPLMAPGLVVAFIFSIIHSWNEFLFAVVLTYTKASQTLPIMIAGFISDKGIDWGPMSASGSLAILPIIVLSLLIQRHIARGLTAGALKG
jgi:multiple sugar transport system permease protein